MPASVPGYSLGRSGRRGNGWTRFQGGEGRRARHDRIFTDEGLTRAQER
jgi:hypothetical protein